MDLRKVRAQTARQNLDMAFNLAEKEFGVTRLLDAEGKDCFNPRSFTLEKSRRKTWRKLRINFEVTFPIFQQQCVCV